MPLDDDQLRELGRITLWFSNIELWVAMAIWLLLDPDDSTAGQSVTVGMSWRNLIDVFERLVKIRVPDPLRTGVNDWIAYTRNLAEERNKVVHSHWVLVEGEARRVRFRKAGMETDITAAKELASLADRLYEARKAVMILHLELQGLFPGARPR